MILPGATLGILGGGQLGRMFVHAATAMGYRVVVLDPNASSPAGEIAHLHLQAGYDDAHALKTMAQQCAVVTVEFENVPAKVLYQLEKSCRVRPNAHAVELAQNRVKEKQFALSSGITPPPFYGVTTEQDVHRAFRIIHPPLILKTISFGYDGKGQAVVHTPEQGIESWKKLHNVACILEQKIDLAAEISVVLARSSSEEVSIFPVAENVHRDGILYTSTVPAGVDDKLQELARCCTRKIASNLDYCGVLAVEYFTDKNGNLFFNEMAPRTHNSGHYTINACYTSQFEQQVRAICDLPLGNPHAHSAVAMVNLLGDLWDSEDPDWSKIMQDDNVALHLYGKKDARPGRKMGHFCLLAPPGENPQARAKQLFARLFASS